jgi:hypothetical protein
MYRSIGQSATELQAELVPAIGTQPGGSVPTVPTCCRRRYCVGSAGTDVGADRCRPATHGADMCRPGPSGPEVARRGTPRAARLCRYQICSSGIFRRLPGCRALVCRCRRASTAVVGGPTPLHATYVTSTTPTVGDDDIPTHATVCRERLPLASTTHSHATICRQRLPLASPTY